MTGSMTPAEWLDLLAARAPALRAAGILRVDLDGIECQFAPPDPPATEVQNSDGVIEPEPDPLDDPASYPGGVVPGFERLRKRA